MKPLLTPFLLLACLLFTFSVAEAQDLSRQERRALIKAIRKGEATTQYKDSIIFVDKIREVEIVREVPTFVERIKEVARDTCLKSRQEVRFDYKHAKEESEKAIKLARIEAERQTDILRLQIKQQAQENGKLQDSLRLLTKLRKVEGNVAEDTVRQDRKTRIAESKAKVKVARAKYSWLWIVGVFAILLVLFLIGKRLPRKFF
jgi:hypothetical protein